MEALDTAELELPDWPTERVERVVPATTRTGSRKALSSVYGWTLLAVLSGSALGGGVWFSATADSTNQPAPASTGLTQTYSPASDGGTIVVPTDGATLVRRAAVAADTTAPTGDPVTTDPTDTTPVPTDTQSAPSGPRRSADPLPSIGGAPGGPGGGLPDPAPDSSAPTSTDTSPDTGSAAPSTDPTTPDPGDSPS